MRDLIILSVDLDVNAHITKHETDSVLVRSPFSRASGESDLSLLLWFMRDHLRIYEMPMRL